MKKLFLLTNAVCFSFLFASCQTSQQSKSENVSDIKQEIKNKVVATDTAKILKQTSVSGTVGKDSGKKKDISKKPTKIHAITHRSPDQEKIDSIKNAKTKSKKQ